MSIALLALLAAAPPAQPAGSPGLGRAPWIVATIEHSEFCPAGNVRLDLATGRFQLTRRAPRRLCDTMPDRPVAAGNLDRKRLAAIRAASRRVMVEGFETKACRDHEPRETITVSNGGTPLVLLTTGFATGYAPPELDCWTAAAMALHELLEETFVPESR